MSLKIEQLLAAVTALAGVVAGLPALDQWRAKRERSKIKEDLEILEKLKNAQSQPSADELFLQEKDLEKLKTATSNICDKIEHKTKQMGASREDRRDLDNSAVFLGVVLLCIGLYWIRSLLQGQAENEDVPNFSVLTFDRCASATLCIFGLVMIVVGFRRKLRKKGRK